MSAAYDLELARPPEPTPEQQAAIEARSSDVFTEAGAGTGKTRVLVERYCDAVTEDGVGPDAILAFTFTERAAGELRERIRRRLSPAPGPPPRPASPSAPARSPAPRARASGRGSRPSTGSAGACWPCTRWPRGMDPRFRVLDEAEAARLGESAFDAALEEVVEAGDDAVARFAAGFNPAAAARCRAGRARAAAKPGSRPTPPAGPGSPGPLREGEGETPDADPGRGRPGRRRLRGAARPARRLPPPLRAAQGRALRGATSRTSSCGRSRCCESPGTGASRVAGALRRT